MKCKAIPLEKCLKRGRTPRVGPPADRERNDCEDELARYLLGTTLAMPLGMTLLCIILKRYGFPVQTSYHPRPEELYAQTEGLESVLGTGFT